MVIHVFQVSGGLEPEAFYILHASCTHAGDVELVDFVNCRQLKERGFEPAIPAASERALYDIFVIYA